MKKITISILITVSVTVILYLGISFIKYELDVSKWNGTERLLLAFFILVFGGLSVAGYLQNEYEKEKK